ncbi:hypothetical protein SmJEL517_g05098 [Synchytrium microbalum]|uniref:tRNA-intron lyase n=1 Tax=Synchytrium microbalum TaxID=1806994 RepID=A0A507C266_9FUNG|nr:uncharacterized protein SmJEL517_g05098 [Synchytrium microbalum]TPX31593.1 hypothetical protein SmJEL517_g05098 [Synchytrium microbalum]
MPGVSEVKDAKYIHGASKVWTVDSMNHHVVNVQYAVRGELAIKADQLRQKLAENPESLPFKHITSCNIGNPQQLGQKPITFFRQVTSLLEYPDLLSAENEPIVSKLYPKDALDRARSLLASIDGGVGAYSHSQGILAIRKDIAKFIEERDGFPSNPDNIFLTAGASPGVQLVLQSLIQNSNVGIMIPIPQYPLYTASIALYDGTPVSYYLDESNEWSLSVEELNRSITEARAKKIDVRALCVINPGNPTGQCLSEANMRDVIVFCHKEKLVLLADEVYQTNVYTSKVPFNSFKKVLTSMGPSYEAQELVSFHSISKGVIGECGRRGGFFECVGIEKDVRDMLYKIASVSLCPPVSGQVLVDLMVNPPKKGDISYPVYAKETQEVYDTLKRRSIKLADALNSLEDVTCNPAQGALYLFPQIKLPDNAIEAAKKAGKAPDDFYALELLAATGVCVVSGSGFGQKAGTWHFRSTFLPPEASFDEFIQLKLSDTNEMNTQETVPAPLAPLSKRASRRKALEELHASPLPIRPKSTLSWWSPASWRWLMPSFSTMNASNDHNKVSKFQGSLLGMGVWITSDTRQLWTDGFFGKGTLSRSEPLYGNEDFRMGIMKRKAAGRLGPVDEAENENTTEKLGYNPERVQLSPYESVFLLWALDCLEIRDYDGTEMTARSLWRYMMSQSRLYATQPDTLYEGLPLSEWGFMARYVVYHTFRARGWVTWSGIKFGVDFVAYRRGPVFSHSEYALVVLPVVKNQLIGFSQDLKWYLGVNRVCAQVKKSVVLCYVHFEDEFTVSDSQHPLDALKKTRISEVTIRRFIPERSRD